MFIDCASFAKLTASALSFTTFIILNPTKPMRAKPTFLILALLLAICPCLAPRPARAQASQDNDSDTGASRVIFGWANSRNNNHATKIIGGLAVGGTFDDSYRHEINVEWLVSSWQTSFYDASGNFVCRRSELHAPLLLNYRYYIVVPRLPCAFHVGGGAGCDFISTSYMLDPAWNKDGRESGWSFSLAAAAEAGFVLRLSRHFSVEFSYRCLWQSASGYWGKNDNNNNNIPPPAPKPSIQIGTRPDIVNMLLFNARFTF